jgi:activator of 2-hydroxyglutaryl-CoA dehydratase
MELNEAKKEVTDLKVRIAELGTEAHEKRLEGRETNQIIKEMEAELQAMRSRCLQIFAEEANLKEEARHKAQEAMIKEGEIKTEEHRLTVVEFMEKQRDFYEVLGERVEEAQKNANHSLIGVDSGITPTEFVEYIKKEDERLNNFSPEAIFTRQARAQYKEALHQIADVHIRGKRVPLELKKKPQNIIDAYLHDALIEQRWNR